MAFTKIAAAGIGSTETVTLHSLEVLNNATVGGVLTYEDVTNVDSIGIITARAGVLVGSGITLSTDGNIFATGISTFTGGINLGDGDATVSALFVGDSIAHTGNTDAKIRFPETNKFTVETGNTQRLAVEPAGNINIAKNVNVSGSTTTGSAKVGVDTGVYGENLVVTGNARVTGITTFGDSDNPALMLNIDATSGLPAISIPDSIIHSGDTNTKIRFPAADTITAETGGSERLRIDSNGRVLIGLLDGSAANASIDDLQVGNPNSSTQTGITIGSNDEGAIAFANNGDARAGSITYNMGTDSMIFKTDGQNERFRIDSNGDVTVGGVTNGGGNRFLVAESHTEAFVNPTDSILRITNADSSANNNQASISFTCSTTGVGADSAIVSQAEDASGNSRLEFWTDVGNGMTEKMTILSDGAVLINSPTGARAVVGTEYLSVHGGSASNTVAIAGAVSHNNGIPLFLANGSNTTSQRLIRFAAGSGGDTRGTITWNGSNIVYGGSSDYRLKKNVTSLTDGITKLKQLKPITFDWIKETDNNNVMGFLAHEVKEVIPQVVIGEKDEVDSEGKPEYQELDYGGMTPLIVAALQEAVSEIETLKAEVAALKG